LESKSANLIILKSGQKTKFEKGKGISNFEQIGREKFYTEVESTPVTYRWAKRHVDADRDGSKKVGFYLRWGGIKPRPLR
jgi:hypothetical protein